MENSPDQIAAHGLAAARSGTDHARAGRFVEALASFDQALAVAPSSAELHCDRAGVLSCLGRHADAVLGFTQALAMRPDFTHARRHRGHALCLLGRHAEALDDFEVLCGNAPANPDLWTDLATTLVKLNRIDEALAHFDRALALDPQAVDALVGRGNLLVELGRLTEALADFDRVIGLAPDHVAAATNRAIALAKLQRYDESLAAVAHALSLDPDCVEAHWQGSLIHLLRGDLENGFREYEWRWKTDWLRPHHRTFPQPQWTGTADIAGASILLHAEQGFGDSIQFCRYARDMAALGARVILQVPPVLMTLMRTLEGVSQLIADGDALPDFDYHCPLLSLPFAFRTRLETIPAPRSYLSASPERIVKWSGRLRNTERLRVGLAWAGRATHQNDRWRSIPLATMLSAMPDAVECISLQKDLRAEDRAAIMAGSGIIDITADIGDFGDTAALIALLDIVVTVDTGTAHLAAAMGVPTWLLLPHSADWRWLKDRTDSPWYPSMRIFRQTQHGNWSDVVADVRRALYSVVDEAAADSPESP